MSLKYRFYSRGDQKLEPSSKDRMHNEGEGQCNVHFNMKYTDIFFMKNP